MGRLLPAVSSSLSVHIPTNIPYIIFGVLGVLSILSLVMFLCASHKRQEQQKQHLFSKRKLALAKRNLMSSFTKANSVSSKALLKMISWRKQVQHDDDDQQEVRDHDYVDYDYDEDDDEDDDDDAVWKKTIIMGGKCKPFDFSGKIEHDSEGNLLPDKPVLVS